MSFEPKVPTLPPEAAADYLAGVFDGTEKLEFHKGVLAATEVVLYIVGAFWGGFSFKKVGPAPKWTKKKQAELLRSLYAPAAKANGELLLKLVPILAALIAKWLENKK